MRLCEPCISTIPTDVDPDEIIRKACEYFDLPQKRVRSKSRKEEIVKTRHMIIRALTIHTKLTLKEIGAKFSNRDHSTILRSRNTAKDLTKTDLDFRYHFKAMQEFVFKN